MQIQALRLVIRAKLASGRLPLNSIPRIWGGPANGETGDACELVITHDEFVMQPDNLSVAEAGRRISTLTCAGHVTSRSSAGGSVRHAGTQGLAPWSVASVLN
jgi:hypothetical protein